MPGSVDGNPSEEAAVERRVERAGRAGRGFRGQARQRGALAGPAAGPGLLAAAVATAIVGALGAFAAQSLGTMTAYLTLVSVGTSLIGVGVSSTAGLSAALYYLVHSTLVLAGLFLLAESTAAQRGDDRFQR